MKKPLSGRNSKQSFFTFDSHRTRRPSKPTKANLHVVCFFAQRAVLSVCMYMCVYIYIYIHIYIYIYVCMYVCMHACMYVCMYVCVCVYIYIYIYIYVCGHFGSSRRARVGPALRVPVAAPAANQGCRATPAVRRDGFGPRGSGGSLGTGGSLSRRSAHDPESPLEEERSPRSSSLSPGRSLSPQLSRLTFT